MELIKLLIGLYVGCTRNMSFLPFGVRFFNLLKGDVE